MFFLHVRGFSVRFNGWEASAEEQFPPEMEEWLKAAKLGPYEESPQNWDEIITKSERGR